MGSTGGSPPGGPGGADIIPAAWDAPTIPAPATDDIAVPTGRPLASLLAAGMVVSGIGGTTAPVGNGGLDSIESIMSGGLLGGKLLLSTVGVVMSV